MQLLDELSMINTTLIMWFATFGHKQSRFFMSLLAMALASTFVVIAVIYHYLGDPVFHQNAYAILTATVIGRSWYQVQTQVKNTSPESYKSMRDMVLLGLVSVTAAFTLWNLDTIYCRHLIAARRRVGMPWGFLFEGHAYWHLLTGLGGYYYITYGKRCKMRNVYATTKLMVFPIGLYLRYVLDRRTNEYEFVWPSRFTSLPYIRRRVGFMKGAEFTSGMNGAAGTNKKNL